MRILSHYFAARFVGLFFTVLVASLLILATVEPVLNLEDVTGLRGSDSASFERGWLGAWASSLRYLGLRLSSYYLSDVLPIASFVAVFVLLAGSGRAMELMVATFSPMDLVFYGIAVWEGWRVSFRQVTPEELERMLTGSGASATSGELL